MWFRAVLSPLISLMTRPSMMIPAAVIAAFALLSPLAVEDASAQGYGMRNSGSPSGRFQAVGPRGPASKSATNPKASQASRVATRTPTTPKGGAEGRYPRRPGGENANPRYPYPKGDQRNPRGPRYPFPIPGIIAIPGGPPDGPPPFIRGGGQPPAPQQPQQSNRRPGTGVPSADQRRYVPNEVVVEVANTIPPQVLNAMAQRHGLTLLQSFELQITGTRFQRLRINGRRSVPQVVRALEADGIAMAVQPNYIATLQEMAARAVLPADLELYAPARMRMPEAHQLATGDRILIAVIDGGVDTRHPELAGMIVTNFDAIGTGDRIHPHGTSIVGAIAARVRLRGMAPGAHILAARAFGTNRNSMDGTTDSILKSIDWAVRNGARVINMSFAGDRDPALERVLAAARQRGIILVAAAGNAGPNSRPLYPAAFPGVIAVTATDQDDRIFRAANRGNHIAVAAPGVDLWLPTPDNNYRLTSGTSFAAAIISGLVALMLERNPRLSPDDVRNVLMATARDLGPAGLDPQFGAGLVDAYQAVFTVLPPAAPTAGRPPARAENEAN
jgi:subtilisin family serine protease